MKLLLNIDQRASLIAGLDAPESTMVLEISAASIPAHHRAVIMPLYNLASGRIDSSSHDTAQSGYSDQGIDLDQVYLAPILSNAGEPEAIAAIADFCAKIDARSVRAIKAVLLYQEKTDKSAATAAEELRQSIAGLLDGTLKISREDAWGFSLSPSGSIRTADMTPETTALADAWKVTQAEAQAIAAEVAAVAAVAAAARMINGKTWYLEEVDAGTVSHDDCFANFDNGRGAKNWLATVSHAPSSPGGLDREFWEGKPSAREIPASLVPGDYVEAGSKNKKGRPDHKYFRILEITDGSITFRDASKPGKTPPDIAAEVTKLAEIRGMVEA